jgi:hypothetical protein
MPSIRARTETNRSKLKPRSQQSRPVLVYRVTPYNGGLVFAPKDVAVAVDKLHRALKHARTWGEFRNMLPGDEYSRIVRASFDHLGERRPKSTDTFSPDQVAGWSDGDYPEWLQGDMDRYLPHAVLKEFGARQDTLVSGSFWMIPPENAEPMIATMKAMGFGVESGRALNFW